MAILLLVNAEVKQASFAHRTLGAQKKFSSFLHRVFVVVIVVVVTQSAFLYISIIKLVWWTSVGRKCC